MLAINDLDEIYSWGKGDYGQLGHKESNNLNTPKIISSSFSNSSCFFHINN